jgi:hypothetical protein
MISTSAPNDHVCPPNLAPQRLRTECTSRSQRRPRQDCRSLASVHGSVRSDQAPAGANRGTQQISPTSMSVDGSSASPCLVKKAGQGRFSPNSLDVQRGTDRSLAERSRITAASSAPREALRGDRPQPGRARRCTRSDRALRTAPRVAGPPHSDRSFACARGAPSCAWPACTPRPFRIDVSGAQDDQLARAGAVKTCKQISAVT